VEDTVACYFNEILFPYEDVWGVKEFTRGCNPLGVGATSL